MNIHLIILLAIKPWLSNEHKFLDVRNINILDKRERREIKKKI